MCFIISFTFDYVVEDLVALIWNKIWYFQLERKFLGNTIACIGVVVENFCLWTMSNNATSESCFLINILHEKFLNTHESLMSVCHKHLFNNTFYFWIIIFVLLIQRNLTIKSSKNYCSGKVFLKYKDLRTLQSCNGLGNPILEEA